MDKQDVLLDMLATSVGNLKTTAQGIGEELDTQELIIEDLDWRTTSTTTRMQSATRRVGDFLKKDRYAQVVWYLIVIIVVVAVALITTL
jgi:hypothetical protein